jgi:hypothetical protein
VCVQASTGFGIAEPLLLADRLLTANAHGELTVFCMQLYSAYKLELAKGSMYLLPAGQDAVAQSDVQRKKKVYA